MQKKTKITINGKPIDEISTEALKRYLAALNGEGIDPNEIISGQIAGILTAVDEETLKNEIEAELESRKKSGRL